MKHYAGEKQERTIIEVENKDKRRKEAVERIRDILDEDCYFDIFDTWIIISDVMGEITCEMFP